MKTKPLATLALKLIGFYSIFSGIFVSCLFLVEIVSLLFSKADSQAFSFQLPAGLASLVQIVFGVVLIRMAGKIAARLSPNDEVLVENTALANFF